jgi:uncharacterized protein (DUF2147 family)
MAALKLRLNTDRMNRFLLTLLLLVVVPTALAAEAGGASPEGIWRVIGDKTGEVEARVRIANRNNVLEGQIIEVLPRSGIDPNALCESCPGARKDQPVRGLTILTGLRRDGDEYQGGEILDPENGDIYRCKVRLSDDNRKLYVRGFIGFSLFGRTQTWIRE